MLPLACASWAQGVLDTENPPGLEHRKWIEPRHMRWQIMRWNSGHVDEIRRAFLNGSGMMIWENIFGSYNPWPAEDRAAWRRASRILREFRDHFISTRWDPFFPIGADGGTHAHRWPGETLDVFTFVRMPQDAVASVSLELETGPEATFYDLWHGGAIPLEAERHDTTWRVTLPLDAHTHLGALAVVHRGPVNDALLRFLDLHAAPELPADRPEPRTIDFAALQASPVAPTPLYAAATLPPGMARVPGAGFIFHVEHMRRECGCYPNPGATPEEARAHLWGDPFHGPLTHDFPVEVAPFAIDEAAVTNAQYAAFLEATHYRPSKPRNFLKHWPGGECPPQLADHPVVYVDIDDARAYARWAGKRLPTEFEWHRAAQGDDGRKWPWGSDYSADCVNLTGATMPARSLERGRSPYGCYHMSGNVYELTESVRSDGHTRYLILRGGSYFRAEGSIWYMDGGPQPCDHHAKCILMAPSLDRCATVGFRCAADLER
jgi:formylglycine-generating enzyme required for sulfatase activity